MFERRDSSVSSAQPLPFITKHIPFWLHMEKQDHQHHGTPQISSDRSGAYTADLPHHSLESAKLHRASQAAEQARAVAAAVAVATAAAADRAASDRAFNGTNSESADNGAGGNREGGTGLGGSRGSGSWRGAAQRQTERALLLHESRTA